MSSDGIPLVDASSPNQELLRWARVQWSSPLLLLSPPDFIP